MKFNFSLLDKLKSKTNQSKYFTIPDEQRSALEYEKFCMKPPQDIFIMRVFQEQRLGELLTSQLSQEQLYYRENGYLILRDFIPHELIDRYLDLRASLEMGLNGFEWDETPHKVSNPHVVHPAIRDIACYQPMIDMINHLHSMEMGLIFSLTSYRSTERGWHQDSYLDSDNAVPRCASWISLGDVSEDSGPFEYVPGSNRWPALSNQRINTYLQKDFHWPEAHRRPVTDEPRWGKLCEDFLSPSIDRKISDEGHSIEKFTASKGDLLIWYGRLMHRGSLPRSKDIARPSLINHYAPVGEKGRGLFVKRKQGAYFLVPPAKFDDISTHEDIV